MANKQTPDNDAKAESHARQGQSLALGDTGDGSGTGVPEGEQGMSNRPGDHGDSSRRTREEDKGGRRTREGGAASSDGGDDQPYTQAGAPGRQDQSHTSLDNPSQSGRARDEGPDEIERTQPQQARREAAATASSDIKPGERETM